jgi:hypothetical protein
MDISLAPLMLLSKVAHITKKHTHMEEQFYNNGSVNSSRFSDSDKGVFDSDNWHSIALCLLNRECEPKLWENFNSHKDAPILYNCVWICYSFAFSELQKLILCPSLLECCVGYGAIYKYILAIFEVFAVILIKTTINTIKITKIVVSFLYL